MNAKDFKEKFDLVAFVKDKYNYLDVGQDRCYISCPFHSEESPSCMIQKDRWYCFGGCGSGGDSIDFLMKTQGLTFAQVLNSDVSKFEVKSVSKSAPKEKKAVYLSQALFAKYATNLLKYPDKLQYLYKRGFDSSSIKAAQLGYGYPVDIVGRRFSHQRYVIPHFKDGKIVTAKYRIDPIYASLEDEKYISHPGTHGIIYNVDLLSTEDSLIYVGSQFDAAVLWYRYQIPAICPPSENIFKDEWIALFYNKNILIWLDNDKTGIEGSLNVYNKIKHVVNKADIFTWDSSFKPKDDFTDFLLRYGIGAVNDYYGKII